MLCEPRDGDGGTVEIRLERLNYGKLASGDDLRIPPSEGYGVTRRSGGLERARDRDMLPPRLMDLRRFEHELIDARLRGRGCFVARAAPSWPQGEAAPMTLLRARFRPEDGENGHGRLYQQSAIWVSDFASWRRYPAVLLALADAELDARPDLLREGEAARFGGEPLRRRVAGFTHDPQRAAGASPGAMRILEMLADGMEAGGDWVLTFGERDEFATESEFLAAAGLALAVLPESFPRWRDISVVSGLRHVLGGLCIRYLPSHRERVVRVAA